MLLSRRVCPLGKITGRLLYPIVVLLAMCHVYFKYTAIQQVQPNLQVIPVTVVGKTIKWKSIVWYKLFHGGLRMNAKAVNMDKCEYKYCTINFIDNTDHYKDYFATGDAIIFQGGRLPSRPPQRKHSNQTYVFSSIESPIHLAYSVGGKSWSNAVNWTMTYRVDSDILYKYGAVYPNTESQIESAQKKNFGKIFKSKTKEVAWLVSDCVTESRREKYVKILQKYVKVDIYGRCGTFKNCTKHEGFKCMEDIAKDYKFYLSFENSVCRDYMTEKVFVWFRMDIINVVRGARTYSDLLPAKTYIDAHAFKSIKDLGFFLQNLSNNENEYVKYLKEKAKYTTEPLRDQFQKAYCDLCKRLHNLDQYQKVYSNVNSWWYSNSCQRKVNDLI